VDAVWIASADAAGEAWVVVCSFSGRRRRIRTRKKKKEEEKQTKGEESEDGRKRGKFQIIGPAVVNVISLEIA